MHLRLEVSEEIHKENFKKFHLFRSLGNKKYMAWISSRLKQQLYSESTYFYQKGDTIDSFYFSLKGVGAFVMSDMNNEIFSIVDPEMHMKMRKSKKLHNKIAAKQYFGAEDIVINAAVKVHE